MLKRLKLKVPDTEPVFRTEFSLQINHLNYGNHLGNDSVLTLAHEARIQYLKSLSQNELDFYGVQLIQTDAQIVYKGQGYHGDPCEITIFIYDKSDMGFQLFYLLRNSKTDKEIARVITTLNYFDYKENKLTRLSNQKF